MTPDQFNLITEPDPTEGRRVKVDAQVTISPGDIQIGAVEIKNGTDDTRATVESDGSGDNALVVKQNSQPLPTGASTEATLTALNAKIPALGQATMANSLPVAIASNQSALSISATDLDIRDLSRNSDSILIYGSDDGGTTKRVIKTDSGGAIQVDLEVSSVTVSNAGGVSAVNIQDGGNSITVDGPLTDVELRATPVPVSGTVTATPSGTQDTNITQVLGVAPSATNPVPSRLTNGTTFLANLGETAATGQFIRLTDGTDTALVTAAGELSVLSTAQPGTDIGDVTINNAGGASAVNVQDGGNSITVDSTQLPAALGQTTMANSLSVAIASNQGSLLINSGGTSSSTGALSKFRSLTVSDTGEVIKNSAGNFYRFNIVNTAATIIYVKFYDKTAAPTNADTPIFTIAVASGAGSTQADSFIVPDNFSNGLGVRCVTGSADNSTASPATSPIIEVRYV